MQDVFYNIILPSIVDEWINKYHFEMLNRFKFMSKRSRQVIHQRSLESYKVFCHKRFQLWPIQKDIFGMLVRAFVERKEQIIVFHLPRRLGNTLMLTHFASRFQGNVYAWVITTRNFLGFNSGIPRHVERYNFNIKIKNPYQTLLLVDYADHIKYDGCIIEKCFQLRCRCIISCNAPPKEWVKSKRDFVYLE